MSFAVSPDTAGEIQVSAETQMSPEGVSSGLLSLSGPSAHVPQVLSSSSSSR
jgi:hypothetical protein